MTNIHPLSAWQRFEEDEPVSVGILYGAGGVFSADRASVLGGMNPDLELERRHGLGVLDTARQGAERFVDGQGRSGGHTG